MKNLKKILVIVLSLMMLIQCFPVFASDLKYTDVKENDWFCEVVDECTKLGIVNGFPDGTFKPSGKLKEDQVIKMVISTYGYEVRKLEQGEYWAKPYIEKAIELKIVESKDMSLYNRDISREEVARIITNAMFLKEERPNNGFQLAKKYIKDYSSIKDEYKQDVLDLFVLGIMQGNDKRMIKPQETITRAEMSAVIVRVALSGRRLPMITEVPEEQNDNTENQDNSNKDLIIPTDPDKIIEVDPADGYTIIDAPIFEGTKLVEVVNIMIIAQKAIRETIGGESFATLNSEFSFGGWGTDENVEFIKDFDYTIKSEMDKYLFLLNTYSEYSFGFYNYYDITNMPIYNITITKKGNLDRINLETYDKYFLHYYGKTFEDVFKYMFENEYAEFWNIFIESLKCENAEETKIAKTINDREFEVKYNNKEVRLSISAKGIKLRKGF